MLHVVFLLISILKDVEECSLFYISRHILFKEYPALKNVINYPNHCKDPEQLLLMS